MARRAHVSARPDPAQLHAVVPTIVLHLVVAGINATAALSIGANPAPVAATGLAACALGLPVVGLALSLAGWTRIGAALVALTYISCAGLALYNFLGLGALETALLSPAASWKIVYFTTAVMLPLLQIKGILETGKVLLADNHR
ncbi:MAG: hypothetical protein K0R39_3005 [Symbiobacteriaceae bacterium]|jgi:hypothetical protein|nr:hypothetical protein [Symbiobacteriaceae bacterium]